MVVVDKNDKRTSLLFYCRHIRDCHLREKEVVEAGENGIRNGINRTALVFKIPLITIYEWQKGQLISILTNMKCVYYSFSVITVPTL
jgi:hypothetical protein